MARYNRINNTYPCASANKFAEAISACSKMGAFGIRIITGAAFAASIFLIMLIFLIISLIVSILLSVAVADVIIIGILSLIVYAILVIIVNGLQATRLKEPRPSW